MTSPAGHPLHRALRRGPTPWVLSLALHALLVIAVAALTTTSDAPASDDDLGDQPIPPVIHASLTSLTFDPDTDAVNENPTTRPPESGPAALPEPPREPELDELLATLRDADDALLNTAPATAADGLTDTNAFIDLESLDAENIASFGSVQTTNARRIAFVIDGSGSMIPYIQNVLTELDRALESLTEEQFYAVIFFQGNEAVLAPPGDRLSLATARNTARTIAWVHDTIVPRGRSNPVAALRHAMNLRPDVIFLMSENITGAGEFEIPHDELLAFLDDLNPVIEGSGGRRRIRINCIQFLEPTPEATLKIIAEQHGGLDGYAEMTRTQLGLN